MSWFSCKEYSIRTSRKRDEPLSLYDRIAHGFHHIWCFACRRFSRQLEVMDHAFECLKSELQVEGDAQEPETQLSDTARLRIREALERQRGA